MEAKSKLWVYGFGALGLLVSLALSYIGLYISPLVPIGLFVLFILIVRTDVFLILVTFLVPLSIPLTDIAGAIGGSLPTEPLIAILMVFTVFKIMAGYTFDWSFVKHPLSLIILGGLIWMMVSTFFSAIPMNSIKFTVIRFMYVLTFYFLLGHLFKNEKKIMWYLWALLASTTFLVIYTTFRHAGEGFVRTHSYYISEPFFMDHGIYAAAVAFLFPVALFFISKGYSLKISRFWRIAVVFMFFFIIMGLVFSFTRAAWVSIAGAMGFYALLKLRVKFYHLLIVLVLGSGYIIASWEALSFQLEGNTKGSDDDIAVHVKSISNIKTDPSNMERVNRWSCAIEMFKERPLVGFGPGTYTQIYGSYQKTSELTIISTFTGDLGNVHSEYFAALSEMGLLGLVFWVLMIAAAIYYGMDLFYKSDNPKHRTLVVIAMLGLLTYFIHAFLNNYSEFDKIAVPMWGFLAIITRLSVTHQNQKDGLQGQK